MRRLVHLRKFALLIAAIAVFCGLRALTANRTAHAAANNTQLGSQIVAQGTKRGAIACARCHGYDGASDGSGAFPILTGQSAYYLSAQLKHFASGKRQNALMFSIARNLSDEEIQSVAAYYSSVRPTLQLTREGQAALVSRGQYIATEGNLENRVQGCVSCHGPNGAGEAPDVPYLAGQYEHYIGVQLKMVRRGYRESTQRGGVGHRVTDEEAAAGAAYFDQLPLPPAQPAH
jgi:cytochrome c553